MLNLVEGFNAGDQVELIDGLSYLPPIANHSVNKGYSIISLRAC